jgi:hypothetical protein
MAKVMSGYMQNPPPSLQEAWWYPPAKFIAHLSFSAAIEANIVPSLPSNIGVKSLHLSRKAGIKKIGS